MLNWVGVMKIALISQYICKSIYSKWELAQYVRVYIPSGSYDKFIYMYDILWISAFVSGLLIRINKWWNWHHV
jgi:hypothetical protein